jgi:cytochrome c biogenesis protein
MKIFIKSFANLKLAIFLLLLIAFFSAIGSIIEQDKPIEFYKGIYTTSFFGTPIWIYLQQLDLTHIYSSWWFFSLLIIFGTCLLSCTFSRQFPALKYARRYYFYTYASQFNKLKQKFLVKTVLKGQLCYQLINEKYSICQKQTGFYGYKGLIGRVGPVIVHLSIIFILLGSILGAIKGFTAQEFVPKSEIFHIQNIVKVGNLAKIPQQTFRINDFWVNFNKTGVVKQFQSDISVLSGKGNEIERKTISVNNPFLFKGLTMYQTDWGIIGLRIKISNKDSVIQLPVSKIANTTQKLWVSWLPIDIEKRSGSGIILILNGVYGKIEFYNEEAKLIKSLSLGQTLIFKDFLSINLLDCILSTGIQIKSDPGIKIIYSGFGTLIVSSLISYISFSEIWFLEYSEEGFCGGKTTRDKVKFNIEMSKIEKGFSKR